MPWHVAKTGRCPASRPWGVIKDADGSVDGRCHVTQAAAEKQKAALYASEGANSKEETMAERRFTLLPVEARAREGRRSIGGYAAVFNRLSQNLGGFVERVDPAFFNKSRGDGWPDVIARYNHDDAFLLGTTHGRTLRLAVDDTGLDYDVDPPDSRGDIYELVERGDVHKSSFAFRVFPGGDDWSLSEQGYPMRTLLSGQLVDVAPVTQPAYLDTEAGLRSLAERFEAEVAEVRAAADANELRRFFVKTEAGKPVAKPKPKMLGAAAAVALLARKEDPWG